jgi:hypothetical protein
MGIFTGLLTLGGLALGAKGQSEAAKAQARSEEEAANIATVNAAIARQNAAIAKSRAGLQIKDIALSARALRSTQKAVIGASGVTREGSPQDIIREGRQATAEDIMTTRFLGADEARKFIQRGTEIEAEAGQLRSQAASRRRLQPFQTGATLLTGGASVLKEFQTKTPKVT